MAYFVYRRPQPDAIAKAAREFIIQNGLKTHDLVERAQARVNDAYEKVEADTGGDIVGLSKMVGEAEAALAAAQEAHRPNLVKLAWENREQWREGVLDNNARRNGIITNPAAMAQPWNSRRTEWTSCFTPRQNKPTGY